MKLSKTAISAAITGLLLTTIHAAIIRVPQDKPTITAGVAAATRGDTLLISDGLYNEHGIVVTQSLTLMSVNGSAVTTVNGQGLVGSGAIFQVSSSNTDEVDIQGLTITGGGSSSGATVRQVSGLLKVRNCIFATNYNASVNSIGYQRSNTFVIDCVFRNNNAENYSGVFGVTAIRCLFYGNTGWNNAIPLAGSDATNCTIYGNSGGFYGGGVSDVNADNCIIWGNDQPQRSVTVGTITYSIVQGGYAGTGNLSSDPLFVNAANGDFHLQTNSPAKNSGDPTILNADGSRSDMGAYGGNFATQAQQDPTFVWTKLPGSTNMPSLNGDTGWRSLPGSMDQNHRIIYSLSANGVFWKYDIGSNLFTQLPVSGAWPGRVDTFIYNPDENAIWFTLYGRGQVFRLPVTGGAFTSVGASGASSDDFGDITFWNPVTHKFATFNGYGSMAVRNWRWEFGTTNSDWVQIEPNTPGRQPWPRSGGSWTVDNIGQRVFHGGGEGNSSGQQGQVDAGFDYFCGDTRFDALRDLWLLDLKSNKWVNLIPLNTAIRHFGPLVYLPPQNMLLMINGQDTTSVGAFVTGVWTFTIGQATNFTKATISGTIPDASADIEGASIPYYDSLSQRVLYFNTNGVYALSLTSPSPAPIITIQPVSQIVNQGSPASFNVTASGTGLNYQWQFNTTNISGATNANYYIASATTNNSGNYAVVVSNSGGSVTSSNAVLTIIPPPRTGTGTATMSGVFVVGVNLVDGGSGYTNTPLVRFIGGGGSGAQGFATVSNGVVISITVTDAGYGYTNTPVVVIEPPFISNPVLGIAPMSFLTFSNLTVSGIYQLQQAVAWYWTNRPLNFTATSSIYTQMFAGIVGSGDFRLALNPVPSQAFASAQVVNGFVVGVTVSSGGSGYVTSPTVSITGGHGTNATAVSYLSGGVVTSISITSAGIGYTNTPTVQIAPPPAAAVSPTVLPVMRMDSASLAPYDNYQIQFTPTFGATWGNWNGGLFTPTDVTNSQYLFITNGIGFFRLQYMP
jgi:hypothetical protein